MTYVTPVVLSMLECYIAVQPVIQQRKYIVHRLEVLCVDNECCMSMTVKHRRAKSGGSTIRGATSLLR